IPQTPGGKAPIRLWSTQRTFQEFKVLGPSKCLEDLLRDLSGEPRPNQYLRRASSLDGRLGRGTARTSDQTASNAPSKPAADFPSPITPAADAPARPRSLTRLWKRGSLSLSPGTHLPTNPVQPQRGTAASTTSGDSIPSVVIHTTTDDSDDRTQDLGTPRGPFLAQDSAAPATKSVS